MTWLLAVLLVQTAATIALVGLIWTVQIVQYPLFAEAGREAFAEYHASHMRRITFVVGPLMLMEGATACTLCIIGPPQIPFGLAIAGAGLVGVAWLATAFLSVPCHHRLARGFDAAAHRRLVQTNWIRTFAWSLRGIVALSMLALVATRS